MNYEDKYMNLICGVPGLGKVSFERLIEYFETPKAIIEAGYEEILASSTVPCKLAGEMRTFFCGKDPDKEMEMIAGKNIKFVHAYDEHYPQRLSDIPSPPLGLYYIGDLPEDSRASIAIVGSRTCSAYGREVSRKFAYELAGVEIDIISGMALGVDGHAHRGAIAAGGRTFAVLGSGADVCYPDRNRDIYDILCKKGGIISEFYPQTVPIPLNFPIRNRIISGLSDAILVVEARKQSGTSITVSMGLEQGREIFAVPGRIDDALSIGCNLVIRQGAVLVTAPEDIIEDLAPRYGYLVDKKASKYAKEDKAAIKELSQGEKKLYKILGLEPKGIDDLALKAGISVSDAVSFLSVLELKGLCRQVGLGRYSRLHLK